MRAMQQAELALQLVAWALGPRRAVTQAHQNIQQLQQPAQQHVAAAGAAAVVKGLAAPHEGRGEVDPNKLSGSQQAVRGVGSTTAQPAATSRTQIRKVPPQAQHLLTHA